jgi:hypothetical protein
MTALDVAAAQAARDRFGLIRREELMALGVSRSTLQRRIAAGVWNRVAPGVIDLGTHPDSWQQALMTVVLAASPGAVVSHRSAGHLHGFLDVDPPHPPDVTVPRGRTTTAAGTRLRTTSALASDDVGTVGSFPVTRPARTLLDLASLLPVERLEPILWEAARHDAALPAALTAAVERHAAAPGRGRLARALAGLHPEVVRAESPLEVHGLLAFRLVRAPVPALQLVVRDAAGRFVARVDAAWPDARVIVEFDGAAYHSTPRQQAADRERLARLEALGWEVHVLRFADLRTARVRAIVARIRERTVARGARGGKSPRPR